MEWNVHIKTTPTTNKMWSLYIGFYMQLQEQGKYMYVPGGPVKFGPDKQLVSIYRWSLSRFDCSFKNLPTHDRLVSW